MNHLADLQVHALSPTVFLSKLHDALTLYVTAMRYSPEVVTYRAQPWREDTHRPGWQAVGAFYKDELAGFAYAYTGSPALPWHQHVAHAAQGLGPAQQPAATMLGDYVELTEIHVHPGLQGHGIGELLLRQLLLDRPEQHVLLSTPEVELEANRAWRLYRRLGFVDIIRNMRFPGDARPFAILGRALPLQENPEL